MDATYVMLSMGAHWNVERGRPEIYMEARYLGCCFSFFVEPDVSVTTISWLLSSRLGGLCDSWMDLAVTTKERMTTFWNTGGMKESYAIRDRLRKQNLIEEIKTMAGRFLDMGGTEQEMVDAISEVVIERVHGT